MKEEDILLGEAEHIVKILDTEGFKNILKWIDGRIVLLERRIINGETDISIEQVTKSKANKAEITVVTVNKDYEKHELKVWKMFKKKISDWEEVVSKERE